MYCGYAQYFDVLYFLRSQTRSTVFRGSLLVLLGIFPVLFNVFRDYVPRMLLQVLAVFPLLILLAVGVLAVRNRVLTVSQVLSEYEVHTETTGAPCQNCHAPFCAK